MIDPTQPTHPFSACCTTLSDGTVYCERSLLADALSRLVPRCAPALGVHSTLCGCGVVVEPTTLTS